MKQRPIDILGWGPSRKTTVDSQTGNYYVEVTTGSLIKPPQTNTVKLTAYQYTRYLQWSDGVGLIQDLLPELSAEDREVLITGLRGL